MIINFAINIIMFANLVQIFIDFSRNLEDILVHLFKKNLTLQVHKTHYLNFNDIISNCHQVFLKFISEAQGILKNFIIDLHDYILFKVFTMRYLFKIHSIRQFITDLFYYCPFTLFVFVVPNTLLNFYQKFILKVKYFIIMIEIWNFLLNLIPISNY